jgi:hypothetical protein
VIHSVESKITGRLEDFCTVKINTNKKNLKILFSVKDRQEWEKVSVEHFHANSKAPGVFGV